MNSQLDLLDKPGVVGMAIAASHADPKDLADLRFHAEGFAKAGSPFTSDSVRAMLSDAANERLDAFPNSIGGLFYALQKEGTIEGVGYAPSTRPEARGRPIRIWRGTRTP